VTIRCCAALDGWLMMVKASDLQHRKVRAPLLFLNAEKWQTKQNIERQLMLTGGKHQDKVQQQKNLKQSSSTSSLEEKKEKKELSSESSSSSSFSSQSSSSPSPSPSLFAQIITLLNFKHEETTDLPLVLPLFASLSRLTGETNYQQARATHRRLLFHFFEMYLLPTDSPSYSSSSSSWEDTFVESCRRRGLIDNGLAIAGEQYVDSKEFDWA
jgi:hypothetical protein